jgi:hypothetical protein
MARLPLWFVASGLALATLLPAAAEAGPPCGRGWRRHEVCGVIYGAPVIVAPPPVYAAPPVVYAPPPVLYRPPVVVAPPPPVVVAPPVVAPAPGLSIGVNIPLR